MNSDVDLIVKFVNWLRLEKGAVLFGKHECTSEHLEKFMLGELKKCPDSDIIEPVSTPIFDLAREFLGRDVMNGGKVPDSAMENSALRSEIEALSESLKLKFNFSYMAPSRDIPKSEIPASVDFGGRRYRLSRYRSVSSSFVAEGGVGNRAKFLQLVPVQTSQLYLAYCIKMFPATEYLCARDLISFLGGRIRLRIGNHYALDEPNRSLFYNEPQFGGPGKRVIQENMCISGMDLCEVAIDYTAPSKNYEIILELMGHEYQWC